MLIEEKSGSGAFLACNFAFVLVQNLSFAQKDFISGNLG